MAAEGWLLDISRLVSRLGQGPLTGIDRVEAAWLRHLLSESKPLFLLCKSRTGQMLLRADAGVILLRWLGGDGAPENRHAALARLRPMALAHSLATGGPFGHLARALRRALPQGGWFLSLGHTNLDNRLMAELARGGLRRAVMIHDVIPLEFPQFAAPGAPARFERRFRAACDADALICISHSARGSVVATAARLGLRLPPQIVAPLGTDLAAPTTLPAGVDPDRPRFVTLGTIEPRKNHALLLDVWDSLPPPRPQLVVIGRRGWADQALFARIAATPDVAEFNTLDDGQVAAVLTGAQALLMPSFAEGFGLPLTEAAARGVAVICADIPVARELLAGYAQFLPPSECTIWAASVRAALLAARAPGAKSIEVPGWMAHFLKVSTGLQAVSTSGPAAALTPERDDLCNDG